MNLLKRRNRSSPLGPSVHSSRVSRLSRLSASKPVRQRPWLTLVLVAQLLVALHLARRSGAYTRKKRQACRAQSGGGAAAAVPVPGGDCAAAAAAIPKIIHQSYKSLAELPAAWQHVPGAWRETHPDYEYRFWSDAANRALIEEHYPWFLSTYDAYPTGIQRADAARYFAVHHHGGVYADMDIVPVSDMFCGRRPRRPWRRCGGEAWVPSLAGRLPQPCAVAGAPPSKPPGVGVVRYQA